MSGRFDVAVVGAGHNGLIAAAYLARAGRSVVVLERRDELGGTLGTDEPAPGFRAPATFGGLESLSAEVVAELDLAAHGLELGPAQGVTVASRDRPWLAFDGDGRPRDGTALSDPDRRGLRRLQELLHDVATALAPLYRAPLPELEDLGAGDTLDLLRVGWRLRRLGRRDMREAMRLLPMAMRDVVEEHVDDELLRAAVAGLGSAGGDLGPWAPGTLFVALHQQLLRPRPLLSGPVFPVGGTARPASALAAAAQVAGVEIRRESAVAQIEVADGRVRGVTLHDGALVEAGVVLSDADPRATLLDLVEPAALDPDFVTAVHSARARGRVGIVSMALDGLPEARGGAAPEVLSARVQIGSTVAGIEAAVDAAARGHLADPPLLFLTIPSLADPSCAPPGKHVAHVWVAGVPGDNAVSAATEPAGAAEPPAAGSAGAAEARAPAGAAGVHATATDPSASPGDRLGAAVEAAIDAVLPGFSERIVGRHVATPADLESRYGSGCLFDLDIRLDQALYLRPFPGWYGYRMPISGLYLCGSGTHAGGGVSGLAGRNAARRVIADGRAGGRS